jgi:hypothetical protein
MGCIALGFGVAGMYRKIGVRNSVKKQIQQMVRQIVVGFDPDRSCMPADRDTLAVVGEWMAKADSDLRAAALLLKMKDCPTDVVCFHAEQCVEKKPLF